MFELDQKDFKIAIYEMSEICRIVSFVFLIPALFSLTCINNFSPSCLVERTSSYLLPAVILYTIYLVCRRFSLPIETKSKHVIMAVALGWFIVPLIGSLPFLSSGNISPLNAFFESMSGWTTTGLSLLNHPELIRKDLLFYRSFSQWVGGIGVVGLALTVLMKEGSIMYDYYTHEVGYKLKPSIRSTLTETWKIYLVYTLICFILLTMVGIPLFDSINMALATLSTGGFSVHSSGVGLYENPLLQLILPLFMIIGSTSFVIHMKLFEGKYKAVYKSIELRYMGLILLIFIPLLTGFLYFSGNYQGLSEIAVLFKNIVFNSISALTTTGFSIGKLGAWDQLPSTFVMFMMFVGGAAGSTAGGIKLLRFIVILKLIKHVIDKARLPDTAVLSVKMDRESIDYEEMASIFALFAAYISIAFIATVLITYTGFEELHALFTTLSALGTVGLTNVPAETWFTMAPLCKGTIILLMWIGRLEIFPVLVLFSMLFKKSSP